MSFIDRGKLEIAKEMVQISDVFLHFSPNSPLIKIGKNYITTCVYCKKEKHLYLYNNIDSPGKCGIFCCFICNRKGDVISLISHFTGLQLGQSIYWFLHEYLGFENTDILQTHSAEIFSTDNILKAVDNKKFIAAQTNKFESEEQQHQYCQLELINIIEQFLEENPSFTNTLQSLIDRKTGIKQVFKIDGWLIRRYQVSQYWYWRATKTINGGSHKIHFGKEFDLAYFHKKIDIYLKKHNLNT